jgi:hypothetical protein
MSRGPGFAATIVVTLIAASVTWFATSSDVPDELAVGDRVQAAVDTLRDSNVYVAPDSADLLSEEDVARIDAAASAASPETFVVVWEYTSDSGFYLPSEGLRQIGQELGRPGHYVSVGRSGVDSEDVGIDGDYVYAENFDEGEEITRATVVAKITAIIDESDGREFSAEDTSDSAYWGGPFGTLAAGALFGVFGGLGLAAVLVIVWFIARSLVRSRP